MGRLQVWAGMLALLCPGFSHAADSVTRWQPVNDAAKSISGYLDLSTSRIVFQDGKPIDIADVGPGPGMTIFPGAETYATEIFRILEPHVLVLQKGNTLCGVRSPPTYLTMFIIAGLTLNNVRTPDQLYLNVFTGDAPLDYSNYEGRVCGYLVYAGPPGAPKE